MSGANFQYVPGDWNAGQFPGGTTVVDADTPGAAGTSGVALGTATGRSGTQLVGDDSTTDSNPFVDVWRWVNKPLTTPLDPLSLFLGVGIVLFAIVAWSFVLYHIRIAAEAI